MAWCKVSSLTAAVVRSLKEIEYPAKRSRILSATRGVEVEGWEVGEFLAKSLSHSNYGGVRNVMADLEAWLDRQG